MDQAKWFRRQTMVGTAVTAIEEEPASFVPSGRAMTTNERIRAIVASSSGNLVEWFDFYVYAFTAIYFAPAFFPPATDDASC